jgi:catechol 2,3-dioxygenase-like lactoylglutathione lyase family enzyme
MFGRKEVKPHVPARIKAFGRARLEIAQRAQSREDWETLWKPPMQSFPFEWGPHWKQCIEYRVDDFAAEVGFLIDVLGLPVNAFNPDYAMFTSPSHEFYFAVVSAGPRMRSTPPDALRIQFMVSDLFALAETLKARGVVFDRDPSPVAEGSTQWVASFHTPHGLSMEIWGFVEKAPASVSSPGLQAIQTETMPQEKGATEEGIPEPVSSHFKSRIAVAGFAEHTIGGMLDEAEFSQEAVVEDDEEPFEGGKEDKDDLYKEDDDELYEEDEDLVEGLSEPENPDPLILKAHQTSRLSEDGPSPQQFVRAKAKPPTSNGYKEPVRLLPRAAVELRPGQSSLARPQESSAASFSPAPKKSQPKKPSSIWDNVPHDVEYLDLENPGEAEEEYHYRPIPLNRDK